MSCESRHKRFKIHMICQCCDLDLRTGKDDAQQMSTIRLSLLYARAVLCENAK